METETARKTTTNELLETMWARMGILEDVLAIEREEKKVPSPPINTDILEMCTGELSVAELRALVAQRDR